MSGFLDADLISVALCWRLERRDGVALGFTAHDRDLCLDGLIYRAAPGMLPSQISASDGLDADALDVQGALTSAAIRAEDLEAGRWDGASVTMMMVDWQDLEQPPLVVARGTLGEVTIKGQGFEAELKGPAVVLERAVTEQTSPTCHAQLGDGRCRVDMAPRQMVTRVTAVSGETRVTVAAAAGGNAYAYGRARWLSGAASGLETAILRSEGPEIVLREPPAVPIEVGAQVILIEGCDKRLETCSGRFGNAANFRGEPHLPGTDLLTRYSG